jgi:hypothetical protein
MLDYVSGVKRAKLAEPKLAEPNGSEDEINHSNIKWTMLDSIYGVKRSEPNGTERKRLD